MFRKKRKLIARKEVEVIDKIKSDIETELSKKGIRVSCMNLNINSERISLNILLNGSRRPA
ncbi:hypothetical protein [Ruminiclostridium papyrosolvens]|uniref:Uncharacterized protein n=1 Tax=Ruminiclostridium papyrosolvens C7 TaxID=1330534 RepID=U4QXM6_9FIRM|nr:hypothetical protein [Ruminiclostridium papyrosolvens]EPR09284.1 hypothetical protein L323_17225 [Ruminiclostridium papyrosolvens C7]